MPAWSPLLVAALTAVLLGAAPSPGPSPTSPPFVSGSYGGFRYETIGTPHRDGGGHIDNAVLLLPGDERDELLRGTGFAELFGPDQSLGVTRYYLIVPDRGVRISREAVPALRHVLDTLGVDRLTLLIAQGSDGRAASWWAERYSAQTGAVLTIDAVPADADPRTITAPLAALVIPGDLAPEQMKRARADADHILHGRYVEADVRARRGGALHWWYYSELARQLLGTKVDEVLPAADDGTSLPSGFDEVSLTLPPGWVVDSNPAGIHEAMFRPHPRGVHPKLEIEVTGGHFGSLPPPPGTPTCINAIRAYVMDRGTPPHRAVAFDVTQEGLVSGIFAVYPRDDAESETIVHSIRLPKHSKEC